MEYPRQEQFDPFELPWFWDFYNGRKSFDGYDWIGEQIENVLLETSMPESGAKAAAKRLQADIVALIKCRDSARSTLSQIAHIDENNARRRRVEAERLAAMRAQPEEAVAAPAQSGEDDCGQA
jgi:hypothetical protein